MPATMVLEVRSNRFQELKSRSRDMFGLAVLRTASNIQGRARLRAPVDTGALRASIQVEITAWYAAEIQATVDYAAYVELGTVNSPAQPYLGPATEAAFSFFIQAIREVFDSF